MTLLIVGFRAYNLKEQRARETSATSPLMMLEARCTSKIAAKIYNLVVSRDQAAPLAAHVASVAPRTGYRSE